MINSKIKSNKRTTNRAAGKGTRRSRLKPDGPIKTYYYNDTPDAPNEAKKKEWLATRKEAGREIDPETAEVMETTGCFFDPYNINPELFEEERPVGRVLFARSPGSDIWVVWGDLPRATEKALWDKYLGVGRFR